MKKSRELKKITFMCLLACVSIFFDILIGCEVQVVDQELRHKYFIECLEKIPKGPDSTKYNDWSEVVSECGEQAYYMSFR